jgi:rhomboid family GlyGly-CTERM serine protease
MGLDKFNRKRSAVFLRGWSQPLLLLILSLGIMMGGETAQEFFRYDRLGIARGEWWRLLSGHLSHLGWSHFVLNGAGLVLIWSLVGTRFSTRGWLLVGALALASMNLGFWVLTPELRWYVGLSGLLHGILGAGLVARLPAWDTETVVLAMLLLAKLGWEQVAGALPGSEQASGGPVIVAAHLYGTVGGIAAALLCKIRVRPQGSI